MERFPVEHEESARGVMDVDRLLRPRVGGSGVMLDRK